MTGSEIYRVHLSAPPVTNRESTRYLNRKRNYLKLVYKAILKGKKKMLKNIRKFQIAGNTNIKRSWQNMTIFIGHF